VEWQRWLVGSLSEKSMKSWQSMIFYPNIIGFQVENVCQIRDICVVFLICFLLHYATLTSVSGIWVELSINVWRVLAAQLFRFHIFSCIFTDGSHENLDISLIFKLFDELSV
jgi:hypothetical protein